MPVGVSAYVPLATKTLTATATSVTFSSISQAYRDLVLVSVNAPTSSSDFYIRFNADTGTNYTTVSMGGNGSSTYSQIFDAGGGWNSLIAVGSGSAAGAQIIVNMMDYSATDKHKTALMRSDRAAAGTEALTGRWANTAAITSVTITQYSSSRLFAIGSSFSLYGIQS